MAQLPKISFRNRISPISKTSPEQIQSIVEAQQTALVMADKILLDLNDIWQQTPPNAEIKRQSAWLAKENFKVYLGIRDVTSEQIQIVLKRMVYIHKRLSKNLHLTIVSKQTGTAALPCKARRNAYAWWPRRIYLCPRWFGLSAKLRGAILIHEVVHQIGVFGQSHHGAFNQTQAKLLAKTNPKLARKSPENYEALSKTY